MIKMFFSVNYKDISLKINEILKKEVSITSIFDRRKQIGLPSNFILKRCLALNKSLMKTYIIGDGMFAKNLKNSIKNYNNKHWIFVVF